MGGELLITAIPHCQLTELRKKKITETVEVVGDEQILSYNENFLQLELPDVSVMDVAYGSGSEEEALASVVKQDILEACFEVLEQGDDPADVASITFPEMNYRVLVCVEGGAPESHRLMGRCGSLGELWDILQEFSQEDFKWQ